MLISIAAIVGLVVVAAGLVYFAFRLRSGEPINLSFGLLLRGYFYLLTIVGLIVLLMGLSGLANVGLSLVLGRDFSYSRPPIAKAIPPPPQLEGVPQRQVPSLGEQEEQADRQQERAFREGLIQGASMVLVGGIVWGVHALGRRRMEREEGDHSMLLHMGYLIILLAISSIVGVVSMTSGINDTLRFYLIPSITEFDFRSPPGQNLSAAIVFAPIWAYYLVALLRRVQAKGPGHI